MHTGLDELILIHRHSFSKLSIKPKNWIKKILKVSLVFMNKKGGQRPVCIVIISCSIHILYSLIGIPFEFPTSTCITFPLSLMRSAPIWVKNQQLVKQWSRNSLVVELMRNIIGTQRSKMNWAHLTSLFEAKIHWSRTSVSCFFSLLSSTLLPINGLKAAHLHFL